MAARIRHIALCVKDIKATADFYDKAFGLKRTPIREGKTAWSCYMSDGEVNLALLQYKSEVGSGVPKGWVGIHHFGFQCDDLPAQQKQVETGRRRVLLRSRGARGRRLRAQVQGSQRHRLRPQLERLATDPRQDQERRRRLAAGEGRGGAQEDQQAQLSPSKQPG